MSQFYAFIQHVLWLSPPSRDGGRVGARQRIAAAEPEEHRPQQTAHADVARAPRTVDGVDQETILAQLRADDERVAQRALQQLYEAFFAQLWRVAYRTTRSADVAEELVQDVFLDIWAQRATLQIRDAISLYLHVAVRNRSYDVVRHRAVAERHAEAAADAGLPMRVPVPAPVGDPADALAQAEVDRALFAALSGISARDRDILVLRWRDGWSFDEIGRTLGISSVAARIVVSRQQRRLREVLDHLREELTEL